MFSQHLLPVLAIVLVLALSALQVNGWQLHAKRYSNHGINRRHQVVRSKHLFERENEDQLVGKFLDRLTRLTLNTCC